MTCPAHLPFCSEIRLVREKILKSKVSRVSTWRSNFDMAVGMVEVYVRFASDVGRSRGRQELKSYGGLSI